MVEHSAVNRRVAGSSPARGASSASPRNPLLIRQLTDSSPARGASSASPPRSYAVYVLVNAEQELYIGQTQDLGRRLAQHNDPGYRGTLHTKRHPGPWRLLRQEEFPTRREAMRREKELKSSRGAGLDPALDRSRLLIRQLTDCRFESCPRSQFCFPTPILCSLSFSKRGAEALYWPNPRPWPASRTTQ